MFTASKILLDADKVVLLVVPKIKIDLVEVR
jgi:hypothetical protein